MGGHGSLGVVRGAALYVGALIGPGVLLVPALAAQAAGAASIVAYAGLLVLSAPLAITFAALGVRHPVAGGVTAYVREGFGDTAAAITGGWFLAAVCLGGPTVALIGGYYVADLTGSGTPVAATIGVGIGTHSRVPLADLMSVGFGRAGRDATAVLAVALTMGTMNVYMGGSAKLAAALAEERSLPRWLAGDAHRTVPRRPLLVIAIVGAVLLGALVAGLSSTGDLVRATSACFIAVYVLAILSATRFLAGRVRGAAVAALELTLALAVFSGRFLAVPAVAGVAAFALHRTLAR